MAGKGFDAKAFLVNHTEKLIFGAAGLMVLAFLGSAQWSPYKGTPEEITDKVAKAKLALEGHSWPEEEQTEFAMTQDKIPKQRVHDHLLKPISVSTYEMSTRFVSTPWQGKEPLRDPALLPLEDAIADAGKVLIERPSKHDVSTDGAEEDGKPSRPAPDDAAPPASEEDDEFATGRDSVAGGIDGESMLPGGAAALGGASLPGGIPGTGAPGALGAMARGGAGAAVPGGASSPGSMSSMMGIYGGAGAGGDALGGGMANPEREAQGYKFVSVRAVFPLKEQIRRFQEAMNAKTFEIAAQSFEVIDFNLERQERVKAQDEWSAWEPVDTQVAIDVLNQSMTAEPDVVQGTVTNNVMTMPLPPRIYGRWKKWASHPRIDKFELTEEQIQQEVEYQSKLIKLMKEGKAAPEAPAVKKGGFSSVTLDSRSLQSNVLGGSAYGGGMAMMPGGMGMSSAMSMNSSTGMSPGRGKRDSSAMGSMAGRSGMPGRPGPAGMTQGSANDEIMKKLLETDDKDAQGKALKEYIEKRVTADGELLLFRYIDFNVSPGKTYRYRVRLVLNNPNSGHLASEANGDASVVEGETRTTAWNNETRPVAIERDVYYFVKDVDSKRGKTRMSVFEWNTKLGTTVNAEIDLYPGQHIAGTAKTNVIDPAKSKFEVKDYAFGSSDVFVETHSDVALDKSLHKDLKLPGGSQGDALLPEEVLVVQSLSGDLAVLDPVRMAADEARLAAQQKKQDTEFAFLKESAAATGGLGGMMGGAMSEMYGMSPPGRGGKGGGRSQSPLAAGRSMMGAGMMMPGSGGEDGMPPGRGRSPRGKEKR